MFFLCFISNIPGKHMYSSLCSPSHSLTNISLNFVVSSRRLRSFVNGNCSSMSSLLTIFRATAAKIQSPSPGTSILLKFYAINMLSMFPWCEFQSSVLFAQRGYTSIYSQPSLSNCRGLLLAGTTSQIAEGCCLQFQFPKLPQFAVTSYM